VHRCLKRVDAVEKVGRESRWALAVCLNLGSVDLQFLTILRGDRSLARKSPKAGEHEAANVPEDRAMLDEVVKINIRG